MSFFTIDLHPVVESDYDNAYHWYELQQAGLGERFLTNLREKLKAIATALETYSSKGKKVIVRQ